MAYSTPTSRSPGNIITSAIWNSDVVNNVIYLKGAAGTISFDAGAIFSGVVTATAGVVATTLSTSGLIKAGGGIVSETNISAFGILNVAGDTPYVKIDARSGTTSYLHFRVLGSTNSQIAVTAADTLFDYGGTNNRLAFRKGLDGSEQIVFTNSGCITVLSGATVDSVDVSALVTTAQIGTLSGAITQVTAHSGGWDDGAQVAASENLSKGKLYQFWSIWHNVTNVSNAFETEMWITDSNGQSGPGVFVEKGTHYRMLNGFGYSGPASGGTTPLLNTRWRNANGASCDVRCTLCYMALN